MFATIFQILVIATSYGYLYPYLEGRVKSFDKKIVVGIDRCAFLLSEKQYSQIFCKSNLHVSKHFNTVTYANHIRPTLYNGIINFGKLFLRFIVDAIIWFLNIIPD